MTGRSNCGSPPPVTRCDESDCAVCLVFDIARITGAEIPVKGLSDALVRLEILRRITRAVADCGIALTSLGLAGEKPQLHFAGHGRQSAQRLASRILARVKSRPITTTKGDVSVTLCAGGAVSKLTLLGSWKMEEAADQALQAIIRNGGGTIRIVDVVSET